MKDWLKTNRRSVLRWVGTILSFVLLSVLVYFNWMDVVAAIRRVSIASLLLSVGFIFLSRLMIIGRWYTLLRSGGIDISLRDTASLTFTGLFASNFLPTTIGGDVVRLAGAMQMGHDRAVCLASIAADRLVNMAGMSMAAPLGIYQLFQAGFLQSLVLAGLWDKGWGFTRRTLASLVIWLKQPFALLRAFLFTWGNLLCVITAYYFLIQGMGEYLPYWKLAGLLSLAYFITLIPVSINGYGLHELSVTFLFSQIGGVSIGVCAVIVVLQRLSMVLASVPGAATLPGVMAKMDGGENRV
jgi:uncharacterized membrane protein YbhN (UPF0104 family)